MQCQKLFPLYKKTHSPQRGFTLIELMVVVSVIAILAVVSVSYGRSELLKMQIDTSLRQMTGLIHQAKAEASQRGRPVTCMALPNGIGCFRWDDLNDDGAVDWSDSNGDGLLSDGEGEVVQVVAQLRFDTNRPIDSTGPVELKRIVGSTRHSLPHDSFSFLADGQAVTTEVSASLLPQPSHLTWLLSDTRIPSWVGLVEVFPTGLVRMQ